MKHQLSCYQQISLREKCPYSEFCWSVFSRIRTDIPYLFVFSLNTEKYDQKNSEYGQISRSVCLGKSHKNKNSVLIKKSFKE